MKKTLFVNNSIKFQRSKLNVSQSELADAIGVTQITISNIEKNKYCPSIKFCLLLSAYFNCSVNELFWLTIK